MAAMTTTTYDEDNLSIWSDLTYSDADVDTDEFGRKLLQHTRDAQRISSVLNSNKPKAFRKARPSPRIASTLDDLSRNNIADWNRGQSPPGQVNPTQDAPSVVSSTGSDPPLNVPREWGRKGRHDSAWLRRIHQDSASSLPGNADANANASRDANADADADVDWLAAANHKQSQTDPSGSPHRRESRNTSTLPSNRHNTQAVDRMQDLEADPSLDLTAASLLASTPALPSRASRSLYDIQQRHVESTDRPATTSTGSLRTMWDRTSHEPARRRTSANTSTPTSTPPTSLRRRSNASNKENRPLSGSRQARTPSFPLYKSTESIGTVDRASNPAVPVSPQRPQSQHHSDSMALLRRLARASSNSPSPTSIKQASEHAMTQKSNHMTKSDTTPRPGASERVQSSASSNTQSDRTSVKTPIVTGAWIDTPRTAKHPGGSDDTTSLSHPDLEAMIPRRRSEPNLPTSALAAVLEGMREHKNRADDDPTLGDSTIASLEGIVNPRGDDPTITLNIPDAILQDDKANSVDSRPTTQADRDKRQEDFALEALGMNLESARKTVHEARRGLRKAGRHSNTAEVSSVDLSKYENEVDNCCGTCGSGGSGSGAGTCNVCGGRHGTNVLRTAWSEYCGLYFSHDRGASWGVRLTWLGLGCVVFWAWLAMESSLCSMYCHPTYASQMHGYGVDPDAPRFPLVIPTLAFRPLRFLWKPILSLLAWCFGVLGSFLASSFSDAAAVPAPTQTVSSSSSSSFSNSYAGGGDDAGFLSGAASQVSWFRRAAGVVVGGGGGDGNGDEIWGRRRKKKKKKREEDLNYGQGSVERMNIWDQGQKAWEAPGETYGGWADASSSSESMLDDEYV